MSSQGPPQKRGFLNSLIDRIPIELHIPGYNFCGPGTKVDFRLARGDSGINKLDDACRSHDIIYNNSKDFNVRRTADRKLKKAAWERVKAKDSSLSEKISSLAVGTIMKLKSGGGIKGLIKTIKNSLVKGNSLNNNVQRALLVARKYLNKKGSKKIRVPRVIPIPKSGGVLPLIPIFTALGALGTLASGASNIAKNIMDTRNTTKKLNEDIRHNKAMEINKTGSGSFLRPFRKYVGAGSYLKPYRKGYGIYITGRGGKCLKKQKKTTTKIPAFINSLPNKALTDMEINIVGKKYLKHFRGVYCRDGLPKTPRKYENFVLNLDSCSNEGTHWVAVSKLGRDIKYYDSFGSLRPPLELMRYYKHRNILFNIKQDQSYDNSNCGHLSLLFLYTRSPK